ncbi:MAG: NIPSNAP family protein [Proteobacteria bacterium]|nr:NIPSNAP family protein [Pseudomonadota bacterium]
MRPRDQVLELRNYVMQPGQRDVLIELFEREFIEPQEALGAHVLGTFRNIDNPDRFVWLRGFADLEGRCAALDGFYTGDVWRVHRTEANATMIDSDDVLLLRPIAGDVTRGPALRPPVGAPTPASLIAATTYFLAPHGDETFAAFFSHDVAPALGDAGADLLATFATEHSPNNYPRLPVRENLTVFVSLARFDSVAAHGAHVVALTHSPAWRALEPALKRALIAPTQTLRLQPTARSLLR